MLYINTHLKNSLIAHALASQPLEMCGLILEIDSTQEFYPCRNVHPEPTKHFIIHPQDYLDGLTKGKLIAIAHSHVDGLSFTEMDCYGQQNSGVPWALVVLAEGYSKGRLKYDIQILTWEAGKNISVDSLDINYDSDIH